ncbi:MAG TPA: type II toxin-antitoxin system VapC family toxin [Rectinema sp.]|jgi:tRNA(fMet)-specific endonuclease VapC|nr:type II toxin-antitoxin system VapC family toxin [Rectinema sp.]HPK79853.1 type II toxin-antitoxin system VapC family toxin [Rectinema sp.]HQB07474.1 type II toxin-antitoxin system VapC family toxin [Rectinema sp.]HQK09592.1 type II toxin-antitoxin system VapC family toxin [Rectinema sp.]HRT38699.1 type II toxin-antitoxin system VapC family toxin [Rectinema sp.]
MIYYLDTNTCIYFLNGKYESIKEKVLSIPPNEIGIPSIVKAELFFGAYKSKNRKSNIEKVEMFLEPFEIIAFDDLMTYVYADIREKMEKTGALIGPNDLLIASIVKFYDGILVTNNEKEFGKVEVLRIENWTK